MGFLEASPREQLIESLQGQILHIPDLQALFANWPQDINPEVERLREDIDNRLDILLANDKARLQKMKKAEIAPFAALWWPYAKYEHLRIAAYFSLWLFLWDDETDSQEYSAMVHDPDSATLYHQQTEIFVLRCLAPGLDIVERSAPSDAIIASFESIGSTIVESCTPKQVSTFLEECVYFIRNAAAEQQVQASDRLPTVDEYMERRLGTSGVGACIALTEYCYEMEEIPALIKLAYGMKTLWEVLWHETNVIISISNDILSFKKELAQHQVDTLIPLLYLREGSIQGAIACAVEMLRLSIQNFDSASKQILAMNDGDPDLRDRLQKFVDGCKYACTANLNWSLISGRYGINRYSMQGGLTLTLGTSSANGTEHYAG